MSMPLVTVVTPAYNAASYLVETIESVLHQAYPNIEYVVLDDGSTDNTIDVLKEYDGRILWDSHLNMGEALTVNKGWEMAHGEYVAIVNADDPVYPKWLETCVEFLEAHPDVLVAYPDWHMIDSDGGLIKPIQVYDYDYTNMVRWHHCLPGPGAVIRRKAFELEGGRNSKYRYVGDFEYWLRLGIHGPFARIPETLVTWRFHAASATSAQKGERMAREHLWLMDDLFARQDLPAAARNVRSEAYSAAYYIAAAQCVESVPALAREYLLKSLLCHRHSRPNGLKRSWALVGQVFVPKAVGRFLHILRRRLTE